MARNRHELLSIAALVALLAFFLWMISNFGTGCAAPGESLLDSWSGGYEIEGTDGDAVPDVHRFNVELIAGDVEVRMDVVVLVDEIIYACVELELLGAIQVCLECPVGESCEPVIRAPPVGPIPVGSVETTQQVPSEVQPPADDGTE